jgi:hypothetical protein
MVINQIHAIGDILFIEPICRKYWRTSGKKPILPVRDHLMWMAEYIDSAEFVQMSKFELDYESIETSNPDYIPLRFANQIFRNLDKNDHSDYENMMLDKYRLIGMNPGLWRTLKLQFNIKKGYALYKKLCLRKDVPYILINEHSQAGQIKIDPPHWTGKKVYMENIPGFTLIDWFVVMMNAEENHHVSTSTFYLLEAMHNHYSFLTKIKIYPRPNLDGLRGISQLNPSFKYSII